MDSLEERVLAFTKKASSIQHKSKVVRIVKHSDIVTLNESIEPKIIQNRLERIMSMQDGAKCIVNR